MVAIFYLVQNDGNSVEGVSMKHPLAALLEMDYVKASNTGVKLLQQDMIQYPVVGHPKQNHFFGRKALTNSLSELSLEGVYETKFLDSLANKYLNTRS
ncbi:hypothetical protein HAX54_025457 [Datura stramonium]|uniref:Uncharacterized protein n=1 Tax=Datura stramonium TaxID=4076 RepID=A0ABS8UZK9_DATST|nr:hypothetical protein [Datura stramonium]